MNNLEIISHIVTILSIILSLLFVIKGAEDETIRSGPSRYKKEALFNPYGTGLYRLD